MRKLELPVKERLQRIKNAGFDAATLWWKGADKDKQPEMVRKLGLQIDNIQHLLIIQMIFGLTALARGLS